MTAPLPNAPSEPGISTNDASPYFVQIKSRQKIRTLVKFALEFIESNPKRPLVLQTIPPNEQEDSLKASFEKNDAATVPTTSQASASTSAPAKNSTSKQTDKSSKREKLNGVTLTIPKLISVVEIIKREFLIQETIAAHKARLDLRSSRRLYQYNHLGVLENNDAPGSSSSPSLEELLSGKHHLKIHRTPYMRIYLCQSELLPEIVGDATYQPPLEPPKRSRAAQSRDRKKRRKLAAKEASKGNAVLAEDSADKDEGMLDESEDAGDSREFPIDLDDDEMDDG
ncbi:hypothetical protein DL93DRAFT_2162788 [Clavulina sp. PMI_390]|nr:hypothetical protein DL93DRAFT_2162788 [Clavulina sp. PMI_390]